MTSTARACGNGAEFVTDAPACSVTSTKRIATAFGLPDVIAHGMYAIAEAARVVTNRAGKLGAAVEYGVRFTRPVVVGDGNPPTQGGRPLS